MELPERGSIGDLVRYRIGVAKSDLQSANILMNEGEYRGANNRMWARDRRSVRGKQWSQG